MNMNKRDDFPKKIKDLLRDRVGSKCSNPDCRKQTTGPNVDSLKKTCIGQAAHIESARPLSGPRNNPNLSKAERSSINNGIWLCNSCAKLIDSDPKLYTVGLLRKWKYDAEYEQEQILQGKTIIKNAKQINISCYYELNTSITEIKNFYDYIVSYYKDNFMNIGLNADEIDEAISKNKYYSSQLLDEIKAYETITRNSFNNIIIKNELNYTEKINTLINKLKSILSFKFYDEGILGNNYVGCLFANFVENESKFNKTYKAIKNLIKIEYKKGSNIN